MVTRRLKSSSRVAVSFFRASYIFCRRPLIRFFHSRSAGKYAPMIWQTDAMDAETVSQLSTKSGWREYLPCPIPRDISKCEIWVLPVSRLLPQMSEVPCSNEPSTARAIKPDDK
jgi:hypothetical protein